MVKKRLIVGAMCAMVVVSMMTVSTGCQAFMASLEKTFTTYNTTSRVVSEAKVGDVILRNGRVLSADEAKEASMENLAIAVVYKMEDGKAYAIGVENTKRAWCTADAAAYGKKNTALQTTVSGSKGNLSFSGYTNGKDGWNKLKSSVSDAEVAGKYPAWEWVNNYGTENCAGTNFTSGWYLPSVSDLNDISKNYKEVASSLFTAARTGISYCLSSSLRDYGSREEVFMFNTNDGQVYSGPKDTTEYIVIAVRVFTY